MSPLLELLPNQTRQYIDAETVFLELRRTKAEAAEVRGSMFGEPKAMQSTRFANLRAVHKNLWVPAAQKRRPCLTGSSAAKLTPPAGWLR